MTEPADFTAMDGRKVPLRLSVDYISFSAHVDFTQNSQFIDEVRAPHVVLVHGEANAMFRLKSALQSRFSEREENVKIYAPKNCETIKMYFRGEKMAKTIGKLAEKYPTENEPLNGILVSKDFQLNIMSPQDLSELGGLITTVITQRQIVPFRAAFSLLKWHLEMMFGTIVETDLAKIDQGKGTVLRVADVIDIKKKDDEPNLVTLEWIGNAMNDFIADSVLLVILSADSSPASVKGMQAISYLCKY